jgi:hypothetical protein
VKKELNTLTCIGIRQSEREMIKHLTHHIVNAKSKKAKLLGAILILSIFASLVLIRSGISTIIPTIKVEPKYLQGKVGGTMSVPINIYDCSYEDFCDAAAWQVHLEWEPSVLNYTSVTWGTFMKGPRIGSWGTLTADAAAGQKIVNIVDGTKYYSGLSVVVKDDSHVENNTVSSVSFNQLTLSTALSYTYTVAAHGGCYPAIWTPDAKATADQTVGRLIFGENTPKGTMGALGSGWLATVQFLVEQDAVTPFDITYPETYVINMNEETRGDDEGEMIKENGYKVLPEDVNANGIVSVGDLYLIGKEFRGTSIQQKDPTSTNGTWTNPTNAYVSDNLRAYSPETTGGGQKQDYKAFGFPTTYWTGVTKVEVGLERSTGPTGGYDDLIRIEISNNGGTSFSTAVTYDASGVVQDTFSWFDFTGAYSWTPAGVANIVVRITHIAVGGVGRVNVDWLTVRVTPTPLISNQWCDINNDGVVETADLTRLVGKFGQKYP